MAPEKDDSMKKMYNNKDFTKTYAQGVEVFTGWFAEQLVKAANLDRVSDDEELVVLDQACGTGIVSQKLAEGLSDAQKAKLHLTCSDFADSMIEFVGPRIETLGVKSAEAVKADAQDTKLPSDKFTHVLLNFGPMVFSDGQAGCRELLRVLKPGGTLAMSSWKRVGWIDDVQAAIATDPEIPAFPTHDEFRKLMNTGGVWDGPAWIKDTVTQAGFVDVDVKEVPHTSVLDTVEEFARMMVGMVGLVQSRIWTQEQREKFKERADEAVVSYMRQKYQEGEIRWDWIAFLTTARKPA
ncbi:putative UbiE/COQ5 family methyltransferase [Cladophialophora carrionii]|uniref:Putative UbiE/COQ5 family methyltransferase n=1 Tax=Cladophialophora carrionii TaxID=86049 RepID=A0A1C1CI14_9EURO|nr:putative UbiE/COQ5 family methyltransferase [Cladophialophora carrionii]